ncbi:MAG: hypothetical protein HY820_43590 [Acidobacteria bacterium]|nr:hypothetical protein [Acidobacteriota bacterium]
MSDLDRLIEIVRELPASKVHALLTMAEGMAGPVDDQAFLQRIQSAAPLELDAETTDSLRAALAECDDAIGLAEMRSELGFS